MKRKLPKYDNGGKIKLKDGVQTNKVDNTRVNYTPTYSKKHPRGHLLLCIISVLR